MLLLLLLSHFSHVRLCATPYTAATRLPRPRDSPGKNTSKRCHFLLLGIFLTQESNWGLLHCMWILYQLSYQGPNVKYKLSLENYSYKFSCWALLLISLFSFISFILPSFLSTICKSEYIHCHIKTTQTRPKRS